MPSGSIFPVKLLAQTNINESEKMLVVAGEMPRDRTAHEFMNREYVGMAQICPYTNGQSLVNTQILGSTARKSCG
jgi:hypothetical protein